MNQVDKCTCCGHWSHSVIIDHRIDGKKRCWSCHQKLLEDRRKKAGHNLRHSIQQIDDLFILFSMYSNHQNIIKKVSPVLKSIRKNLEEELGNVQKRSK